MAKTNHEQSPFSLWSNASWSLFNLRYLVPYSAICCLSLVVACEQFWFLASASRDVPFSHSLAGGIRYSEVGFSNASAQLNSSLLVISVVMILIREALHYSDLILITGQLPASMQPLAVLSIVQQNEQIS